MLVSAVGMIAAMWWLVGRKKRVQESREMEK